jgi:hypothetical protein
MKLAANHLLREGLLPWSVVSRPLKRNAPTIDAAVGYNITNTSLIPKPFLSLLDDLTGTAQTRQTQCVSTPQALLLASSVQRHPSEWMVPRSVTDGDRPCSPNTVEEAVRAARTKVPACRRSSASMICALSGQSADRVRRRH